MGGIERDQNLASLFGLGLVYKIEEADMPNFCVKFFNTLCSSDGHRFKVLQRTIKVKNSKTAVDAAHTAHRDFERLEHVPYWKLHADCCEVKVEPEKSAANSER